MIRIPGWCKGASARLAARGSAPAPLQGEAVDGYLRVEREWRPGDRVELDLPMPPRRIRANPLVRADAGKVAIAHGPLVYCLEGADNGPLLSDVTLARDPKFSAAYEPELLCGVTAIRGDATRSAGDWNGALYREADFSAVPVRIKAIPYYAWANRGENEMKVWINQG
jgi:DUF1680 family protein